MPNPIRIQAAATLRRARRIALASTAAVLATILVAAPGHAGPPVTGGPPPSGNPTVKLLNGANGDELCLSPAGGSNALNNAVVQYYCDTDPARLWEILTRTDGYVELYNESSNLCLSPAGGSTAAGTPLVQYTCDTDPARGWTLVPTGDAAGSYLIQNEHSTLCISTATTRAANAQAGQAACDNTDPTRWTVSYHDAITDVHSLWCLDPTSDAVNATIVQAGCAHYRITKDTTGWYAIQDTDNQLCLSPAGGSTARNATIVQYYCDTDPSRHWQVTRIGAAYQIWNQHSGLCLSPAGGTTTRDATIVQYTCDNDPSRLWTLTGGPTKL